MNHNIYYAKDTMFHFITSIGPQAISLLMINRSMPGSLAQSFTGAARDEERLTPPQVAVGRQAAPLPDEAC